MVSIPQHVLAGLLQWERAPALAAAHPIIHARGLSAAIQQGALAPEDVKCLASAGLIDQSRKEPTLSVLGRNVCYAIAEWFEQHRRPWDLMRDNLPSLRHRRMLDLGCGEGFLVVHALRGGADLAVGIDRLSEMVDFAQAALCMAPPDRRRYGLIVQSAVEALPFEDARFDLVTARVAFNFFKLPLAVPEIARVLVVGGELYMTVMGPEYYARKLFSQFPPREAPQALVALSNAVPTFFGWPAWRFRGFGRESITAALHPTALRRCFGRQGLQITSIHYGPGTQRSLMTHGKARRGVYLIVLRKVRKRASDRG